MSRPRLFEGPALRGVYAACLLVATCTHALPLIQHGIFWGYGGGSRLTAMFWTSLAFADPLAAILLFVWPRLGLVLTTAIIVLDVLHNGVVFSGVIADPSWIYLWTYTAFALQIAFLVFVIATVRTAWAEGLRAAKS